MSLRRPATHVGCAGLRGSKLHAQRSAKWVISLLFESSQASICGLTRALAATNATLSACGAPFGNRSPIVIGIPASFGSLAILLVIIRVVGRLWITKVSLDWDDYLVVAGMVHTSPWEFVIEEHY